MEYSTARGYCSLCVQYYLLISFIWHQSDVSIYQDKFANAALTNVTIVMSGHCFAWLVENNEKTMGSGPTLRVFQAWSAGLTYQLQIPTVNPFYLCAKAYFSMNLFGLAPGNWVISDATLLNSMSESSQAYAESTEQKNCSCKQAF